MKFFFRQLLEVVIYHLDYFVDLIFKNKLKLSDLVGNEVFTNVNQIVTENGRIRNNQWGRNKIPSKKRDDYKQLINETGWVFQTPRSNHGVIGYPSIIFNEDIINVGSLNSFVVNYTLSKTMEKKRKFNTAFDFWLSTDNEFSFETVTHEVMIWDDYYVSSPGGKYKETIKIRGNQYRVYQGFMDKTGTGIGTDGWEIITFLRVKRTENNMLNIKDFFDYLISENIITSQHNVVRSELGNEVYNASGKSKLMSFGCEVS